MYDVSTTDAMTESRMIPPPMPMIPEMIAVTQAIKISINKAVKDKFTIKYYRRERGLSNKQ